MEDDGNFAAPPPLEARGLTGPFGKFTEELKTHVDEHTYQLFLRWCAEVNVLPGAQLREFIYMAMHGQGVHELAAEVTRRSFQAKGLNQALLRGERE